MSYEVIKRDNESSGSVALLTMCARAYVHMCVVCCLVEWVSLDIMNIFLKRAYVESYLSYVQIRLLEHKESEHYMSKFRHEEIHERRKICTVYGI